MVTDATLITRGVRHAFLMRTVRDDDDSPLLWVLISRTPWNVLRTGVFTVESRRPAAARRGADFVYRVKFKRPATDASRIRETWKSRACSVDRWHSSLEFVGHHDTAAFYMNFQCRGDLDDHMEIQWFERVATVTSASLAVEVMADAADVEMAEVAAAAPARRSSARATAVAARRSPDRMAAAAAAGIIGSLCIIYIINTVPGWWGVLNHDDKKKYEHFFWSRPLKQCTCV